MAEIRLLKLEALDRINAQALSSTALARVLATQPAEPSLVLDFARGGYGSGDRGGITKVDTFGDAVTFTRASTATYWDADGVLQTAAADAPRFERDPITGEALGLRVEAASTNMLARSTDVSNAAWSGTASFTFAPATSAIAGQTAQRVTNNGTASDRHVLQGTGTFDGGWQTVSVIWEADTATAFALTLWDLTTPAPVYTVTFDTSAMTATPSAGTGLHRMTDLGIGPNGGRMVRAEVSGIGTSGNSSACILFATGIAQNTNAAIVHHTQAETQIGATSPIVTVASAVTRAADDAVYTGNVAALGIEDAATVAAFGREPRTANTDGIAAIVGIKPMAERISVGARDADADGTYNPFYQQLVGTDQDSANVLPQTINPASARLALAWDAASVSGAHDGAIVWTAAKTATRINPVDGIDIGALTDGARKWGGTIARIVLWPRRLTDAQLQEITA